MTTKITASFVSLSLSFIGFHLLRPNRGELLLSFWSVDLPPLLQSSFFVFLFSFNFFLRIDLKEIEDFCFKFTVFLWLCIFIWFLICLLVKTFKRDTHLDLGVLLLKSHD
ncbi:hypothetical protein MANES_15G129725v8 [Manihot esculenta]|uniref:Uncharacterized protein n=1 Tax=Manihot esculenta TaxID=3983 RepID=A0ACB7GCG5_MANES|nr:hypothetical protein MANES_15G129725v8 [Manihot esculenta]